MIRYAKPDDQTVTTLTWSAGIAQLRGWEEAWRVLAAGCRTSKDVPSAEEAERAAAWFGNLALLADERSSTAAPAPARPLEAEQAGRIMQAAFAWVRRHDELPFGIWPADESDELIAAVKATRCPGCDERGESVRQQPNGDLVCLVCGRAVSSEDPS